MGKHAPERLIKVGALDVRRGAQPLEAMDQMVGVSKSRDEAAQVGQLSMFDMLGAAIWVARRDLLRRLSCHALSADPQAALAEEKELLGVYVSSYPLQQMVWT